MIKPKQGEQYKHWKGKNHIYEIVTVAKVNGKQFVYYKSLYNDEKVYVNEPFSRPLIEFIGYKEFDRNYTNEDGKEFKKGEKVKRFTKVNLENKLS